MSDDVNSRISLERSRMAYCERIYDIERTRAELLDRKAHLYLSLLALFVGGLTLKIDSITNAGTFVKDLYKKHPLPATLLAGEALIVAGGMIASFLLVLIAAKLRPRERPFPDPSRLVVKLFHPEVDNALQGAEEKLLRESAQRYALAVEKNNKVNTEIAICIDRLSTAIVFTLLAASSLIVTLTASTMLY